MTEEEWVCVYHEWEISKESDDMHVVKLNEVPSHSEGSVRIQEERVKRRMSIDEFARYLGITPSALRMYETNSAEIPEHVLKNIS